MSSLLLTSRLHEGESATRDDIAESLLNREESLKAIQSLHATVRFDDKGDVEEIWFQDPVALSDMGHAIRDLSNDDLKWVTAFPELKRLSFAGCYEITDAGMHYLQPLSQLEELDASYTSITGDGLTVLAGSGRLSYLNLVDIRLVDRDLVFLSQFESLTRLSLSNATFSNDGLASLRALRSLEKLYLGGLPVSDDGMVHLSNVDSLLQLQIDEIPITDESVRHFSRLSDLRYLRLKNTKISKAGVSTIRRALPECVVNWTPGEPNDATERRNRAF
ncbi:hypothetical protein SH528x_003450 [Novipirellula sp. SH528]|uniref:hypothetical protein n=1 Tax=Novipirellula sp. SH528 TaxID=3454466 RepID=UPI003FA0194B